MLRDTTDEKLFLPSLQLVLTRTITAVKWKRTTFLWTNEPSSDHFPPEFVLSLILIKNYNTLVLLPCMLSCILYTFSGVLLLITIVIVCPPFYKTTPFFMHSAFCKRAFTRCLRLSLFSLNREKERWFRILSKKLDF